MISIKAWSDYLPILKIDMVFYHYREIEIMLQVGVLIWSLFAITLSGAFVMVVLLVPQLDAAAMQYIPLAAALGAGIAILPSWMVTKAIVKKHL